MFGDGDGRIVDAEATEDGWMVLDEDSDGVWERAVWKEVVDEDATIAISLGVRIRMGYETD